MNDEEILRHFDGKPAFREFRMQWSDQDKATFCRLARAVHNAGLDWWHMGKGIQVRFGRKKEDSERAVGVLGRIVGKRVRKILWARNIGSLDKLHRQPLTEKIVVKIEAALVDGRNTLNEWLHLEDHSTGLWPDQLLDDPSEPEEDPDDDDLPMDITAFNRIYYGPPGTGKTWTVTELLKRDYEQEMTSKEWRNQFFADEIVPRIWWEVIFMALNYSNGQANVDKLLQHPFILAKAKANDRTKHLRSTIWSELQAHTISESTTVRENENRRRIPRIFDKNRKSVWQLAGDWKELCKDQIELVDKYRKNEIKLVENYRSNSSESSQTFKRHSFVTFHQSYGYEEFVEGLRPVLDDADESGAVKYEIRDGVFKELCRRASETPDQRFAMVIDEINRGNISKIFGELITLIELDKREGADNAISVTLPYSGDSFSIPPNVDIIGTMNTADRSLALLDTALRRRFDFVPVMPNVSDDEGTQLGGLRVTSGQQEINIPLMLSAINQRIEALYDRDHCIGHAYFTSLKQVTDGEERMQALSDIFSKRIIPLLEEYFFEDWQKIRLVLADNQKPVAAQFVSEIIDQEADLTRLFGNDHGLTAYGTKRRYQIQNAAFNNPDAYIRIYEKLQDS